MIVFLICEFSLPASSTGCLGPWSLFLDKGVACCFLDLVLGSSGFLAAPSILRFAEIPTKAHRAFGSLGKLPFLGLW